MARRRNTRTPATNNDGATTGALAGAVGASALSGAGGTTVTSCPPGDESFYCKFVKGFNIFKMILFIIAIIVIAYFIYKAFFGGKGGKRR